MTSLRSVYPYNRCVGQSQGKSPAERPARQNLTAAKSLPKIDHLHSGKLLFTGPGPGCVWSGYPLCLAGIISRALPARRPCGSDNRGHRPCTPRPCFLQGAERSEPCAVFSAGRVGRVCVSPNVRRDRERLHGFLAVWPEALEAEMNETCPVH